jgi:hypothetical protein
MMSHLTANYNDRSIGRGDPMAWPPRSADLTQMDFFLWGHIKALIYMSPVDSKEDRIVRITEAATWHFGAHTSISAASLLAVYRGRWTHV